MASDSELLQSWRGGDATAGRALFERYFEPLYRFFANKVGDGVEDMIQETLLACVEGRDRVRDGAGFRTYVFTVARNRLYKRWRRRSRKEGKIDFGLSSVVDLGDSPSVVAADNERDERLVVALRTIPADLQVALELFYWEDLSASEIAEIVGVPEGTARSRLRRGRALLAERLAEADAGDSIDVSEAGLAGWAASIRAQIRGDDGPA
ncbi:MAG: sigma-70 family RNA polymerase sigma factor [Myxococcota bacterium]